MFIGREHELNKLQQLYREDKFQMVVLYGRRRIGKTTLISKFIEDKPAIFFTAQEANDAINLAAFSRKVTAFSAFLILPVPFPTGMPRWNLSAKRQRSSSLFWRLMNSLMRRQKTVLSNRSFRTLSTIY